MTERYTRCRSLSIWGLSVPRRKEIVVTPSPVTIPPSGPIALSEEAQRLFDSVNQKWSLTPPVEALLRLVCEAMTKREICDAIVAREGLTVRDAKGAAKEHPAAQLAYKYQSSASHGLTKLLSNLA